jgi:hypothetical protein
MRRSWRARWGRTGWSGGHLPTEDSLPWLRFSVLVLLCSHPRARDVGGVRPPRSRQGLRPLHSASRFAGSEDSLPRLRFSVLVLLYCPPTRPSGWGHPHSPCKGLRPLHSASRFARSGLVRRARQRLRGLGGDRGVAGVYGGAGALAGDELDGARGIFRVRTHCCGSAFLH